MSITRLREMLGESYTAPETEADTFFTDARLQEMLDSYDDNHMLAAIEGWDIKVNEYAKLIDRSEGGVDRKLSQMYRQAKDRLAYYSGISLGLIEVEYPRVVGVSAEILGPDLVGPEPAPITPESWSEASRMSDPSQV